MGKAFRFPVEADRLADDFAGALSERQRAELARSVSERDRRLEDYVSAAVRRFDYGAKGDLIAGTAPDRFDRFGVGDNGLILTADSAAAAGMSWKPFPTHDHPHSHDLSDYAGPTLRLSGITAPSPMAPGENIEYGWHFQSINYGNPTYFTYTAGGNIITVVKAGRYLISFQFSWSETLPFEPDYPTRLDFAVGQGEFLLGDRWVHIAADGATVIDSHSSPSGNYTTNEGTTQTILVAGSQISASYQFFDRTMNVPSTLHPTVAESGTYWPQISVTYLGPN